MSKSGLGRLATGLLSLVAGACTLLGVVSRFGDVWGPADGMNYVALLWLGAGIIALLLLLLIGWRQRGWRLVARGSALAFLLVLLFQPYFPYSDVPRVAAEETAASASAPTFKLLSFNLWKDNRDPVAAARWIAAQNADAVVLLESADGSSRVRKALEPLYPYQVSCLTRMRCSTLILSREKPILTRPLAKGDPENGKALSAVVARIPWHGEVVDVVGVHLPRPWPFASQTGPVRKLMAAVRSEPVTHMIVAGDFNATPRSFALRRVGRALGLRLLDAHFMTWPAPPAELPSPTVLQLDHVYVGPGWHVTSFERGPVMGSDHYPVIATLTPAG